MNLSDMMLQCGYSRGLHEGCGRCIKVATDADGGKWCCGETRHTIIDEVSGAAIPATPVTDGIHAMAHAIRIAGGDPRNVQPIKLPAKEWRGMREAIGAELPGFQHQGGVLGEFMWDGLRFAALPEEPNSIGAWLAEIERARSVIGPHNPAREAMMWAEQGLEKSRDMPASSDDGWRPRKCAQQPHAAAMHIYGLETKLARIEAALNSSGNKQHDEDQQHDADGSGRPVTPGT